MNIEPLIDHVEFIRLIEKIRKAGTYSSSEERNPHYDPKFAKSVQTTMILLHQAYQYQPIRNHERVDGSDRPKSMKLRYTFEWRVNILGQDILLTKSDLGMLPPSMDEYRLFGSDWSSAFIWDGSSRDDRHIHAFGVFGNIQKLKFTNFDGFKGFWAMAKMFADTDFDL